MDMLFYALLIVGAYLVGAIPFGLIIGKLNGVDIRTVGSGNIGATNVTRAVGKTAGKVCFFLDFLKGALPVLAAQLIYPGVHWLALVCGGAAVIGHIFPVYLKFKGGKGIATAAGGAFAIAPLPLIVALALWGIVFEISRYVSLASIVAAAALPLSALVLRLTVDPVTAPWYLRVKTITVIAFAVIGVLAIFRHRSNIQRLLNGTESRFERKK